MAMKCSVEKGSVRFSGFNRCIKWWNTTAKHANARRPSAPRILVVEDIV